MRILIVGGGVIGHIYGLGFNRSGHDVTLLGRNRDAIERMSRNGVEFVDLRSDCSERVNLHYVCGASVQYQDYELIVLAVRNDHLTGEMLAGLADGVDNSGRVLLFHLGFSGPRILPEYFSTHQVLLGYAITAGGFWDIPGSRLCYHVPAGKNTALGSLGQGITSDVREVAKEFARAGFECQLARGMPDDVYQTSSIVAALAAVDRRHPSVLDGDATAQEQELLAQALAEAILVADSLSNRPRKLTYQDAMVVGLQQAREFSRLDGINRTLLTRYFRGGGTAEVEKLCQDVLGFASDHGITASTLSTLSA